MTYEVSILTKNLFDDESINDMFKSLGSVPQMDVSVDFHTKYLYDLFIKQTISKYVARVSPNICQLYLNNKILEKILEDNPNIDYKKYFSGLDAENLTKELTENILPLPK